MLFRSPFEGEAYPQELRSDEALAQAWARGQGAAAALGYYDHYGWMSLEPNYEPSYRPDLPGWRLEPGEEIDDDLRLPDDCYAMIRLDVAQEVLGYPLTEQTLQEGVAELLRVAALIGRRVLGSHSVRGAQEPDGKELKAQRALLDFQTRELDRLEAELNAAAS